MTGEVITVGPGQKSPPSWDACVFIDGAAPGPDSAAMPWRSEIIALLRERWTSPGRLVVFMAEPGTRLGDVVGDELTDWYERALDLADVEIFWWPEGGDQCLMLTNLVASNDGQRAIHGAPSHAPHARHLLKYADRHGITTATTLEGMTSAALGKIGTGALRTGAEREVPLPVWRTDSYQQWYAGQTSAGNIVTGARQVWTFSAGARQRSLIYWALHVRVYVSAEDRVKSNEVVISRPDISVMALYQRGATLDDTVIVLVREFRSTAATRDGFVHELPGGSESSGGDALDQAISEAEEETGLAIDVRRIRAHGSRQLAAAVSAHHAHLFSAEITGDELARLRAAQSTPHGAGDTEQTWIEITTFGEIRRERLVDWATIGMITEAVLDRSGRPPA